MSLFTKYVCLDPFVISSLADASPPPCCCGLQKQTRQWDMKMYVIGLLGPKNYLHSTGFTFGIKKFNRNGQILNTLYVYKPPFQQLWKDILNFKRKPCWGYILNANFHQNVNLGKGCQIRIATFESWNLLNNAITLEVDKVHLSTPCLLSSLCIWWQSISW